MVQQLATEMGGKLELFYFAFGVDDFFIILDLPRAGQGSAFFRGLDVEIALAAKDRMQS